MAVYKKKYMLIAKCLKCSFTRSNEVEVEPENLTSVRMDFARQVASEHGKHPDVTNFDVTANEM
jgi:hypothetical protein